MTDRSRLFVRSQVMEHVEELLNIDASGSADQQKRLKRERQQIFVTQSTNNAMAMHWPTAT